MWLGNLCFFVLLVEAALALVSNDEIQKLLSVLRDTPEQKAEESSPSETSQNTVRDCVTGNKVWYSGDLMADMVNTPKACLKKLCKLGAESYVYWPHSCDGCTTGRRYSLNGQVVEKKVVNFSPPMKCSFKTCKSGEISAPFQADCTTNKEKVPVTCTVNAKNYNGNEAWSVKDADDKCSFKYCSEQGCVKEVTLPHSCVKNKKLYEGDTKSSDESEFQDRVLKVNQELHHRGIGFVNRRREMELLRRLFQLLQ